MKLIYVALIAVETGIALTRISARPQLSTKVLFSFDNGMKVNVIPPLHECLSNELATAVKLNADTQNFESVFTIDPQRDLPSTSLACLVPQKFQFA